MANGRFDIEARFKGFDDRISTVENALVSLDKKFDATHIETSSVLKDIQKSLAHTQARQGPGFMQIVYMLAACAGVLGVISTGITMLVSSQFSGPLATMQTQLGTLNEDKKDRDQQDAQELRDLKQRARADYDRFRAETTDRVRTLETAQPRTEWVPRVHFSK